jgi:steroid delta-isomerase-like uncharacterized protein
MRSDSEKLIRAYYDRFNAKDVNGFLGLLAEDVKHDINLGGRETGKEAFGVFLARMNRCYDEAIVDLVIMTNEDGTHGAAEFTVLGKYIATDMGLPPARGQVYKLPGGAFFEIKNGKVARIANTYNLHAWLKQVTV